MRAVYRNVVGAKTWEVLGVSHGYQVFCALPNSGVLEYVHFLTPLSAASSGPSVSCATEQGGPKKLLSRPLSVVFSTSNNPQRCVRRRKRGDHGLPEMLFRKPKHV
jgi:hypothetical protein